MGVSFPPIRWAASSIHSASPLVPDLRQPLLSDNGIPVRKDRAPVLDGVGGYILAQLPHPSRALVLAFRGAQRKQEEQRRKLEQQVTLLEARQAEELAVLEATTRVLGRPRPASPPPGPGETFL